MTDTDPKAGPDEQFSAFLTEGRFMIQRGTQSGTHVFFPRVVAPGTGEDLEWVEASGRGIVYSTTVVRKRPPEPNVNVTLVDLAEGPRMMSRVEDIDPAEVRIGMAVRARIIEAEDGPLLVFVPDATQEGAAAA
ncbi:Zn-ribbon domain-containing OB-fold protein [Novosphingobium tardum]|uniref:Zn-ribbon domain-containing OB-fold protein n=1 Tax=Novosphingobium tardum TaxID=1538021 RepID=A0ABV8RMU9_9SPHN